ncbi:MAG TPA: GNAT family N-acetyltransferase [Ktedonobacteraceae bacterium]
MLLRAYRTTDAEALFAALNASREHLYPWFPFFHQSHYELAETRDMLVRWQASWLLREQFFLGLFLKASGQFLGSVGFEPRNWESRFFEIGYWLCQQAQGHGYVTEAVRLLTVYLFRQLDAQRVEIRCDVRNQRSAAVARRLGFQQEGCLRNVALAADGVLETMLVFALIPADPL